MLVFVATTLMPTGAVHATDVGGIISTNTTWTLAGSPYIVTSNILVSAGARLTIEPGVTVKFNAGKSMQIDGELIARGTSASRVTFTANGGGGPGAWGYILFTDTSVDAVFSGSGNYQSGSIIQFATVEYGGGADVQNNGALRVDRSAPYIDHTIVRDNDSVGIIAFNNPNIKLTQNTITNNAAGGVSLLKGGVVLSSTVSGNGGNGIEVGMDNSEMVAIWVSANTVDNNGGAGISAFGGNITDNIVRHNQGSGIFARDSTISGNFVSYNDNSAGAGGWGCWSGGGIAVDYGGEGKDVFENVVFANQAQNGAGLCIHSDAADVFHNLVLSNIAVNGGGVHAACYHCGQGGPVTLSIHHNVIVGNEAATAGGIWSEAGRVESNTILRNFATSQPGVSIENVERFSSNLVLANRSLHGEITSSIYLLGEPTVRSNNFLGNSTYILETANAQGLPNLDATGNWWGTTDDATIQALIYDWFDDSGLGIVDYKPYLTTYNTQAPISPPTGLNLTLGANAATVRWAPNPESDTAGYRVHWDTDSGYPYANVITATGTTHTLSGLGNRAYYIAVTAYDTARDGVDDWTDGNESWFSEEVIADFGPPTFPLSVTLQGGGAGAVTSSPAGIACGSDCSERYLQGTIVVLTATTTADNLFTGWGGACTGVAPTCSLVMNAARAVTATFDLPVPVPDVTGLLLAEAEAALAAANLATGAVTTQPDEFVPAGYVLSQNPHAGTNVAPWSVVDLVVSAGPAPTATATPTPTQPPPTATPTTTPTQPPPTPTPTATPRGDAYEPDDTCATANALAPDGSVQQHTFHKQGDQDWVRFTVLKDYQYVIATANPGAQANTVLGLFDSCAAAEPVLSDDNEFGQAAQLVWTATAAGAYYVKVNNHDAGQSGANATYELSIRGQAPFFPVAIIAGGRDTAGRLQPQIDFLTNQAYRGLRAAGVPDDRIFYLSPSPLDGRDQPSSSANLRQAIITWAADKVGPGIPFFFYLVDHGGHDTFLIDGNDVVRAADLDGWLNSLEEATGADNVNVVIEACRSGSFVDGLDEISGAGRVLITSTSAQQNAYASSRGAYFSDVFLTAVGDSQNLWTSFELGRDAVRATGLAQTPWLDDNGNGMANDGADGALARQRGLFSPYADRPPVIDEITATMIMTGDVDIAALVRDDTSVASVEAMVYAPSFVEPPPGDTTLDLGLPSVSLTDADGDLRFTGVFTGAVEAGLYRIVVYAEDSSGNQALPQQATVRATGGVPSGEQMWLPLVVR